jgi:ribosome biogenesis GTPase
MLSGLVIQGSRNIFTVRSDGDEIELICRIKGKVLKGFEGYYNPLAPGDRVSFERDPQNPRQGLITRMEERRNMFTRLNRLQKGRDSVSSGVVQVIAANVDLLLCVTSPASPPFRPRFLDRLLIQAEIAGIPPVIVCNKADLQDRDINAAERLSDFIRIGYPVLFVSALTGEGMDVLYDTIKNRFSVLLGQSGVGKSSLINALIPDLNIRVGELNEKYDRGKHTTTMSAMLEVPGSDRKTFIIDTPGIRRFVPEGLSPQDVMLYMREFAPLFGLCTYGASCSHRSEAGCKIMEAVACGEIHEDRYESFLRIQEGLDD